MRTLLLLIGFGALALFALSLWRRGKGNARGEQPDRAPEPPCSLPGPTTGDGPLPTSPGMAADAATAVDASLEPLAIVQQSLHALAFDVERIGDRVPTAEIPLITRTLDTLEHSLDEPRYMPRRPSVLPELMRATADEETSRRELASIVARDPTLAGELLKLANSVFYRPSPQPVESVDRAIAQLGTDGMRALVAAALLQPVFRIPNVQARMKRFPLVTWDHAFTAGMAAETSAALIESDDPFAAQLLALIHGLGSIVVFRVASDIYAAAGSAGSPEAFAMLLDRQAAPVARRIATSWQLSERMIQALNDQSIVSSGAGGLDALTPLGRCLARGRALGALALLAEARRIDAAAARTSALALGVPALLVDRVWIRLQR